MLTFSEPTLDDIHWAAPLLRREGLALCDYSFPVLYCWRETYRFRLCRFGGRVLVRLTIPDGPACLWPAGEGDPAPAVEALRKDAHSRGEPLRLLGLTEDRLGWLEARYPGRFAFSHYRDGDNYLYRTQRLADLAGKKLHAKRNHIHRFEAACPHWFSAPLTDADTADCLALEERWLAEAMGREGSPASLLGEHRAVTEALLHREALGMEGIVLREGERLLAFSLGAPLTETVFDVHFERGDGAVPGAYAAVNRAFARAVRDTHPELTFLNREEDMGLAGLRQAKLSYAPDALLVYKCAVETAAE